MKTDWKHREEFFLIIISTHYKLGPILQANAYCQVSSLQDIRSKIEKEKQKTQPKTRINRAFTVFDFNQISKQLQQLDEQDQFKEMENQMPQEDQKLSPKKIKEYDRIGFFLAANLISQLLLKNKNQEVYLSVDGFMDIQKHYQFLCHVNGKKYGFPNEILCQKLYLGNKFHAENFKLLQYLGITHVLNVTRQIDNHFEGQGTLKYQNQFSVGIIYKKINIKDENSTQIKIQFPLAYEWIDQALKTPSKTLTHKFTGKYHDKVIKRKAHINFSPSAQWNLSIDGGIIDVQCKLTPSKYYVDTPQNDTLLASQSQDSKNKIIEFQIDSFVKRLVCDSREWGNDSKVFVHCRQGMSRSATLVIMYIMRKFKLSLADSVRFVRSRRICIDPNDGFMKQLGQFQKKLHS